MAEFCEKCFKKIHSNHVNEKLVMSKDIDLCEGCGEYKSVVICIKQRNKCLRIIVVVLYLLSFILLLLKLRL